MSDQALKFPKGFLWGSATSSHQVEGNAHNDWSVWEKENAKRLASEAKSKFGNLSNWTEIEKAATSEENYISGRACDHYNRYEEDFDLAKSLGHNAHRFSLEWSRIEPEEGRFDEEAIEHYRKVLQALRSRGLEPFVTLWHWTDPVWIGELGAWKNEKTVDHFLRFAERVFQEYKDLVKFWIPLNEPSTAISYGYLRGQQPPAFKSKRIAKAAFNNLMQAHRSTYKLSKSVSKDFQIGCSHFLFNWQAYKDKPWNKLAAVIIRYFADNRFFSTYKDSVDFFGVQYYQSFSVNLKLGGEFFGLVNNEKVSDWPNDLDWQIQPEGIYNVLKNVAKVGKPIYITENGIADRTDKSRVKFIREHLKFVKKAIDDGVDVRGYFHWSLIDNFEFVDLRGFWPRFGLVEVDYKTLERKVRPSAFIYKQIIENGLS